MRKFDQIALTERDRAIVERIRDGVKAARPDATVIFFGSRARGDAYEYSDWDVLILTETVTPEVKDGIYDALYEIELEHDIIIGPLILPRDEWEHKRFKNHPIHERIDEEGALV